MLPDEDLSHFFHLFTDATMNLILASNSPRRHQLLTEAGYAFQVIAPDDKVECGVCSDGGPASLVAELACKKAADVATRADSGVILAADTVAECQGQILGKPADREHAREMLARMSGREHRVLTGVCVWPLAGGEAEVQVDVSLLRMDSLSEQQLDTYLESHAWEGKAGAFGYQDGLDWVHLLRGSESNVVGLPMELLKTMLADAGYHD